MLFISQLLNGLQLGSIYALVALGYSMVYGIIMLLNFAHGDIIMIGGYIALFSIPDKETSTQIIKGSVKQIDKIISYIKSVLFVYFLRNIEKIGYRFKFIEYLDYDIDENRV